MNEISSRGRLDSSGRVQAIATNALLGVLGSLIVAQLAPWGDLEVSGYHATIYIGAVAGLVTGLVLRRWLLIALDIALLATYLTVGQFPVMMLPVDHWVRIDSLPADTADAVVALSGDVLWNSSIGSVAADRLLSALELMRAGRGRRLVTTRVARDDGDNTVTTDADQGRLISLASLSDKWITVPGSHNTREEALGTAVLLFPEGQRRIIVVTSPMHTRRACAVFEAVGFTVTCRASRERDFSRYPPVGFNSRIAAFRAYAYERAAMIKYRMKGWLTPAAVVTPRGRGSS